MSTKHSVTYHNIEADGINIFYREAGDPTNPTILLLHGFPSSSHMYRDLIPSLADQFHLIAPDYPGSGNSDYPGKERFKPTFANLAQVMTKFIDVIGLRHFIIYMQDFGGPVGFRIALKHPQWVDGFIIQNANAYLEGINPEVLRGMRERSGTLTAEQLAKVDILVSRSQTIFQYRTGAKNPERLNPDAWNLATWTLDNPDGHRIQAGLLIDYHTNLDQYPQWQQYLRKRQPRILIVWGKNDPIFLRPGAEAFKKDVPATEIHFYDTGHFALEEEALDIAEKIKNFYS